MSGNLAPAMKTYLQQAAMRLHLVASIAWPIGDHNYTEEGGPAVGSDSLGVHLPLITSMGPVHRLTSDRDGGLQGAETTLELLDNDKVISNALASRYGDQMEGSAIAVRFAPGDITIPPASWAPVFAGVVELIDNSESRKVVLTLRPDDLPLRRIFPQKRIHQGDWPHAANDTTAEPPTTVLDRYAPLYWGKWDSRSAGGGGAVEAHCVDNRKGTNNLHMWQQGCAKRILAAYHTPDGTRTLLDSSDYSLAYESRGDAVYSCVRRTSAIGRFQGPVTVDFEGLTDAADGSGDLVENPAEQIAQLLDEYVYPDGAPIDAAYLADTVTFFNDHGIKGSLYVKDPESAGNVLDRWAACFPFIRLFWTFRHGVSELAIRHREWRTYPYTSDPLLRWITEDDGKKMVPARIRRSRVDRYVGRYLTNGVNGSSTRSLAVRDASLGYDASEDLDMPFSLAALG